DTQTVALDVDGSEVDNESVTLDGDASQQVSFAVATAGLTVGDHDVTVSTDDDSASTTFEVTADEPANQDPSAAFDATPADPTVGEDVTFDASASTDSDGSIESYEWDFDGDGTTDASGEQVTNAFAAADDYAVTLTVTDDDGATAETTQTVSVSEAPDPDPPTDGPSTEVSLSPESELVAVGDSAEYDVVVDDADGGVGVYSMTVTADDPSVASITDASVSNVDENLTDVEIAEDGSSATMEAVLVDTDDNGSVTLGTVTVESAAEGTTDVSLDVSELGDESGNAYEVTAASGATLEASTLVVGDSDAPAQDPDGDGVYEDVNGDGSVDVLDVQTLFADRDGSVVQNSPDAFDFNGDGEFSLLDIQTLFAEETG
ncbi:PKD domain-containing protein, partial [Halorubrum sp. Eb13]|uniref:PKD domain-containing protein n=1 Tax=Halorubrum sp. Eb13 TaxID=1383843 RepID=UPI000BDDA309